MGLNLTTKNLSEIAEVGYEFELKLPGSGGNTGAFIKVRGAQSKAAKAYGRKKLNELEIRRKKGKGDITFDEAEDFAVETAISRIIGWRGIEEGTGKNVVEVAFSPENADRVLREHPWIQEQVMEESNNIDNFLGD